MHVYPHRFFCLLNTAYESDTEPLPLKKLQRDGRKKTPKHPRLADSASVQFGSDILESYWRPLHQPHVVGGYYKHQLQQKSTYHRKSDERLSPASVHTTDYCGRAPCFLEAFRHVYNYSSITYYTIHHARSKRYKSRSTHKTNNQATITPTR